MTQAAQASASSTANSETSSESTVPKRTTTAAYRITVNGIFPESPTENWGSKSLDEKFNDDDTYLSEQAETDLSSGSTTSSTDNSTLKKDNAPKLRVESSHTRRGKAYTVNGKRYVPFASIKEFSQTGVASWYGPGFHGKKSSNGERFNQYALTAAHKELPLNSMVKVTRVSTGKSIVVRITDRGPFHKNRVIDLSYGAAKKLGIDKKGADKVTIELITDNRG
ncbi:septal ring lytic transglycosylase RlpA family protein [Pelistega europaea]|uniref:Endolytic peptidoglycan transglycosylase RlpA n=2 Tax=Pelistega europaea TaxID=106147 RepID=A0A7Y4LCY0_9BURK|nr:septal ring lytic transglycosylase RlpA family protein [Pelistega europaea]